MKISFKKNVLIWSLILSFLVGGIVCYNYTAVSADVIVYVTPTGSKYHAYACGNGKYNKRTLSYAKELGLTECSKCGDDISYSGNASGKKKAKSIKINKTSAVLVKGQTLKLKVSNATKKVKWSSTKKSVATVSSSGKVTAKKKGTAKIKAKVHGKTFICKVKVKK